MAHNHSHHGEKSETKNLKFAFFLNSGFTIIEFIGGFYTNSVAIMSDALHDLGDSFSLGLSWYFQHISSRSSNEKFTYGYKRYSVLGALVTSVVLLIGSIIMITEAIPRLINPEQADARNMIIIAVFGILVNGLAVLRLKKGDSLNERAVMLHLIEDVLGWIAVLIGAVLMFFYDIPIIDPILSLTISLYVLFNVYRNLRAVMRVILQGVPENINKAEIIKYFETNPAVQDFHDVHVWSLDGKYNILTVHIELETILPEKDLVDLKLKLRDDLQKYNVNHATIEFDFEGFPCEFDDD